MSDNSQTTDPLADENKPVQYDDYPVRGVPDADITLPATVRDPGKGNNGGAPLWRGAQASDFD
jgi:hypothetical protein